MPSYHAACTVQAVARHARTPVRGAHRRRVLIPPDRSQSRGRRIRRLVPAWVIVVCRGEDGPDRAMIGDASQSLRTARSARVASGRAGAGLSRPFQGREGRIVPHVIVPAPPGEEPSEGRTRAVGRQERGDPRLLQLGERPMGGLRTIEVAQQDENRSRLGPNPGRTSTRPSSGCTRRSSHGPMATR